MRFPTLYPVNRYRCNTTHCLNPRSNNHSLKTAILTVHNRKTLHISDKWRHHEYERASGRRVHPVMPVAEPCAAELAVLAFLLEDDAICDETRTRTIEDEKSPTYERIPPPAELNQEELYSRYAVPSFK